MKLKSTRNSGFTLVELLVVISIIGMLASVVFVSLGTARAKSRDAVRKANLSQLSKALEIYYNDHGAYPPSAQAADASFCTGYTVGNGYSLPELLTPAYMATIPLDPLYPNDPQDHSVDGYGRCLVYYGNQTPSGSIFYRLYAHLENPSVEDLATMNLSDTADAWFLDSNINYKFTQTQ